MLGRVDFSRKKFMTGRVIINWNWGDFFPKSEIYPPLQLDRGEYRRLSHLSYELERATSHSNLTVYKHWNEERILRKFVMKASLKSSISAIHLIVLSHSYQNICNLIGYEDVNIHRICARSAIWQYCTAVQIWEKNSKWLIHKVHLKISWNDMFLFGHINTFD